MRVRIAGPGGVLGLGRESNLEERLRLDFLIQIGEDASRRVDATLNGAAPGRGVNRLTSACIRGLIEEIRSAAAAHSPGSGPNRPAVLPLPPGAGDTWICASDGSAWVWTGNRWVANQAVLGIGALWGRSAGAP